MKTLLMLFVLVLAGCDLGGLPTSISDQLDDLSASHEVTSISCDPSALEIATSELGVCSAFNASGTRIEYNAYSPVVWTSSAPGAVSIATDGGLRAETVVDPAVTITARGTNGSSATTVVSSF